MINFQNIENITILGVGLIGGSLGLALKQNNFPGTIIGLGRRLNTLEIALERSAVDAITLDFSEAIEKSDMIVISTPVEIITSIVQRVAQYTRDGCVITDVGSVKRTPVAMVENLLPDSLHFVGGHPMAGSEQAGVTAARADLFDGAMCILTPTEKTAPHALELVRALWESVGARITVMSPDEHDFLIAAASHLPHLTACMLAQTVGAIHNSAGAALDFTATGFRDTTRVASGSPDLWKGILLNNNDMLVPIIEQLIENLERVKRLLSEKNELELEAVLRQAKEIRDSVSVKRDA